MIVIEMEDDNLIVRVHDSATGKDVNYRIEYVAGDEE